MKLRITTILFTSLVLLGISSCSDYRVSPEQSEYFTKYYGGPGEDNGRTIRKTNDGGFIIAGTVTNTTLGHEQAYIAKLDSKGDLTWQRSLGDTTTFGTSVNLVSTGGYILCGYVMNSTDSDIVLYKFDKNGSLETSTIFPLANNQIANDIMEIPSGSLNGDFIIVGADNGIAAWFGADQDLSSSVFSERETTNAARLERVIADENQFYSIGTNNLNQIYIQRIEFDLGPLGVATGGISFSGTTTGYDIIDSKNGNLFCLGTNILGGNSDMILFKVKKTQVSDAVKTIRILDSRNVNARSLVLNGKKIVVGGHISSGLGDQQKMFMCFDTATTNTAEYITEFGGGDTETGAYLVKDNDEGFVQIGNASADEGNIMIEIVKVKSNGTQTPD